MKRDDEAIAQIGDAVAVNAGASVVVSASRPQLNRTLSGKPRQVPDGCSHAGINTARCGSSRLVEALSFVGLA
jgi:hypothetical protein